MENKQHALARPLTVTLLAILCNALWGSAIPFINLGYRLFEIPAGETATQILFAGCRFFISGVLTIALTSLIGRRFVRPKRQNVHMVLTLALMQTVIQYVLFYIGVARTTGVKGAIIQGLNAFVAILIACYIFRTERMNRLKWIGGAAGVAGVVVMNLGGAMGGSMRLTGEGFLLLSMIVSACSAGTIKIFGQREDPVALSGWQFMIGGAVMAAIGFALGGRLHVTGVPALCVLLYLAGVSAVAYTLWSVLLKYNPVSRIAPFMFLQPIFGVFLSLLFDPSTQVAYLQCGAALALVCASIVIVGKGQQHG
ncbi:MAG: DMT family transporter [Clostridia bacterium]|nr:DMT family transporter [Clostridia bacterium]